MIVHHPRSRPDPWSAVARNTKGSWKIPFVATEHLFDWTVFLLSNWSFLEALEYMGSLSVLIAVVFYFSESDARIKQRHYQAWQVINTAQGKGGSGGRIEALQELHADKIALTGVDVAGAFLQGLHLERAILIRANFHNADVRNGSFVSANLSDADLSGANFRGGNLQGAAFRGANLTDSDLDQTDLQGADLTGAILENADLSGANLKDVHWQGVSSIKATNLYGAKNAPPEFVSWAVQHGAVQTPPESTPAKL
jgi:hypothetical protein